MKKALFYLTLVVIFGSLLFLIYKFFINHYYFILVDKNPRSAFGNFILDSKIQAIDKKYQLPEESLEKRIEVRMEHPYCGFKSQAGIKINEGYYTNGLGERSPTLGVKRKGVVRIAMIGGSVVFNGAANDKTIIGVLAKLLKERGYKVEYINAGIISGITNQELSVVVHDLLDLQVDLIISLDGYNDVLTPLFINGRVGWPWIGPGKHKFDIKFQQYYPAIDPLINHLKEADLSAIVSNYLNNIHKIQVISKAFNIKYLAVIQPMRRFNAESCRALEQVSPVNELYCRFIWAFDQLDHEGNGAAYVSLADSLKNNQDLFLDDCHVTDRGNELIAEKLLDIIEIRKLLQN